MDETIYGKCGYRSVKWEFRKFSTMKIHVL